MNKFLLSICGICLFLSGLHHPLNAQQTTHYETPEATYRHALELFQNKKYGSARPVFQALANDPRLEHRATAVTASYYQAVCAYHLEHADAAFSFQQFLSSYPENVHAKHARLFLARGQFRNKKYRKALKAFATIQPADLSPDEQAEYNFKMGFCYLKGGKTESAAKYMAMVKDTRSSYAPAATYYYAHNAYELGQYEVAREHFTKIEKRKEYRESIPYYLMHIWYQTNDFESLRTQGPTYYQSVNDKRKPEMARLLGDAYLRAEDYTQAVQHLAFYHKNYKKSKSRNDYFQLGYAYYHTQNPTDAIAAFQKATGPNDSLSQRAWYHLGACYLQTDEKKFASEAFQSAFKNVHDQQIAEDALFNYVKLAIELNYNPYNSAQKALQQYLSEHPNSARKDEAYGYMVQLFLTTNNYQDALATLDKIASPSPKLQAATQQIAYNRALELIGEKHYLEAIRLLKKVDNYPHQPGLRAASTFWTGELYYRLGDYDLALKYYKKYRKLSAAGGQSTYSTALYGMAYAHFNKKQYEKAGTLFWKFLQNKNYEKSTLKSDAFLRLADTYFIRKSYQKALSNYQKALDARTANPDYALYQKALCEGALGNLSDKAQSLTAMVKQNSRSVYRDDAMFELGTTYLVLNNNQKAMEWFHRISQEHPRSPFAPKALLKSGLTYYNNNQNTKALETLKQAVSQYPGSSEAKQALASIKTIYVEMGNADAYITLANQLAEGSVSGGEQDSLIYQAAENQFLEGRYEKAHQGMNQYLSAYPRGIFAVSAHFYRAECARMNGDKTNALADYQTVISQPGNGLFIRSAQSNAAQIAFALKDYPLALENFQALAQHGDNTLAIQTGLMRCHYQLNHPTEAIAAARMVLKDAQTGAELNTEANFVIGMSKKEVRDLDNALVYLKKTTMATKSKMGAQAKYNIALLQFHQQKIKESEATIFELISQYAAHDYWVAKSFILLADVYIENDNNFQARQTLQSIIDNYDGPELVQEAQRKLSLIQPEKPAEENPDTLQHPNNL